VNHHFGRRSAALLLTSASIVVAGALTASSPAQAAPIGATNSDFNGDGYGDLAAAGYANGGTVTVLYGSPTGLTSTGSQAWTADSPGIPESHDGNDLFGSTLTSGDFNGDGFSDLAAGNSLEDVSGQTAAGGVTIIYGSASGLTSTGAQFFSQDSPGIQGGAEQNDQFALSLAAGNLGKGAQDDLVVGVPRETHVNAGTDQGVVQVIFGSPTGLTSADNQLWTQDSAGIADVAEDGDEFGYALDVANFGGSSTEDLAIGVPQENYEFTGRSGTIETYARAGLVHVLYGSATGPTSSGSQVWTQNSSNILDTREPEDQFGFSLAAGNLGGNIQADLAIGALTENDGAGAVHVIYGSSAGLSSAGNQLWSQDSPNILGSSETSDHFGGDLEVGNVGNGAQPDLIVGAPGESFSPGLSFDGVAHVIFASTTGLVSTGNQVWSQDSPGIAGNAETGESFGSELEVNNYGGSGEGEIAVGMMHEWYVAPPSDGIVQVIYGALAGPTDSGNQIWSLDSPGVPGSASATGYFGYRLG
jgi:FG-GAP repeat